MKTIKVNDMSCMHCVKKIQTELLSNDIEAKIDLASHTVEVDNTKVDIAAAAIRKAGYTPEHD